MKRARTRRARSASASHTSTASASPAGASSTTVSSSAATSTSASGASAGAVRASSRSAASVLRPAPRIAACHGSTCAAERRTEAARSPVELPLDAVDQREPATGVAEAVERIERPVLGFPQRPRPGEVADRAREEERLEAVDERCLRDEAGGPQPADEVGGVAGPQRGPQQRHERAAERRVREGLAPRRDGGRAAGPAAPA